MCILLETSESAQVHHSVASVPAISVPCPFHGCVISKTNETRIYFILIYLFYNCSRLNCDGFLCLSHSHLPAFPCRPFHRRCLLLLWMTLGDVVAALVVAVAVPLSMPCRLLLSSATETQSDLGEKVWKYNIWVPTAIEWPGDISAYNIYTLTDLDSLTDRLASDASQLSAILLRLNSHFFLFWMCLWWIVVICVPSFEVNSIISST